MKAVHIIVTTTLVFLILLPAALAGIGDQDDNVLFWLRMDEAGNDPATLVDQADNMNFTNGGSDNATGISGPGYSSQTFDGAESATSGNDLDGKNMNTLMFWVQPDATWGDSGTGYDAIIEWDDPAGSNVLYTEGVSGSCANEALVLFSLDAGEYTCYAYSGNLLAGTWYHIAFSYNASDTSYDLYVNGSQDGVTMTEIGGGTTQQTIDSPIIGAEGAAEYVLANFDEFAIYNVSLTGVEIKQAMDNNTAGNTFGDWGGAPPAGTPYDDQIKVTVADDYDGVGISGVNVTLSNGLSNLTDAAGITTFDANGTFNYSATHPNYFGELSAENATNATDGLINLTGAWVEFNTTNLLGAYLQNFSACNGATCNYTNASATRLLLAPNRTFNITILGYDGNHSPDINDTNQTYINFTTNITTTGQDLGPYNISGLYQSNLTINVSIGTTETYISNFTANITGPVNRTNITTEYVAHFLVMAGDYEASVDPVDYSISHANISIALRNWTPRVTIPAYALNSFYLTLMDEITRETITENMTIELISDASSGTYSTLNGTKALELLTPAPYTIRYRAFNSSSYVERDYYQNLVANNYYNLNLYSILLAEQKSLIVTVLDTSGAQVENATVKLLRYYTYCNCYEVVEMAVTAASGEAYFNVDEIDGHYKTSVDYAGVNRFLSTSPENFYSTESLITRTITINLGSDFYESLRASFGVGHSLSYNNATGALSFAWSDPSGLVGRGCLYAEYLDGVHYTQLTPSCQNASVGSVVLSLPEYGNVSYKYYAELEYNTQYSNDVVYSGIQGALLDYNFGPFGAFMGGLIVVSLALLVSFSAIAVVIMSALGVIALSALGFLPLGTAFIVGFATLALGLAAYFMRS